MHYYIHFCSLPTVLQIKMASTASKLSLTLHPVGVEHRMRPGDNSYYYDCHTELREKLGDIIGPSYIMR